MQLVMSGRRAYHEQNVSSSDEPAAILEKPSYSVFPKRKGL